MNMQLSVDKLKQQRDLRAWTQSHLAEVSGISLRTIQRIEKSGVASQESTQSICAAYEIKTEDLLVRVPQKVIKIKKSKYNSKFLIPAIFSLGLVFSFKFNSKEVVWLWQSELDIAITFGFISIGLFTVLFYKSKQIKNV
jgi:transcriptional regulator with XRE-family HTH domain